MSEGEGGGDHRVLGMLGTLVWDTIYRDAGSEPVEEWGGIAYSLSAFEAAGPSGWRALPIIKVGRDLRREADRLLESYRAVGSLEGVRVVPEPNNRVELRYSPASVRRCERLVGGVPGWEWPELAPLVDGCDALYVNFIAGWELGLETARRLRREFDGLLYADLHSLLLEVGPDGVRELRPLDRGREWVGCFDYVQMNLDELETLARGAGEAPWDLARSVVGGKTRAIFVTMGPRGAAWVTADGGGGRKRAARQVADADPTGCGDSWGIACFGALLEGERPSEAVVRANEVAARNAGHRGGTALAREA